MEQKVIHRRNDEIEALRAFAVLFVLVEHISALLYWRGDIFDKYVNLYVGVDLFFCISGFVITSAFSEEIIESTVDPKRYWRTVATFYVRRAYRILPLSWVAFAATLAVIVLIPRGYHHVLQRSLGDFLAIAFNVENIHYASCSIKDTSFCGSFGAYWSLSLEEQFYFVFPLLFLLPRKIMIGGLVAAVIIFAFLPRTPMVWMTRIDSIALGVLLGLARSSEAYSAFMPTILLQPIFRWAVLPILLCGLAVIPTGIVPFYPTMVSVISLLLVFIASHDRGFLVAQGTIRSFLVWIGQRSFAIYLLHNPVFWIVAGFDQKFFPGSIKQNSAVSLTLSAVLIAAVADLSFRLLESPLRRQGKKVSRDFLIKS